MRKKFKKIAAAILAAALLWSLCACTPTQTDSTGAPDGTTDPSTSAPPSTSGDPSTGTPVTPTPTNGRKIAIDAGHQAKANLDKEPLGPGSSTMKTKVAVGSIGCETGKPEYELTLEIALKLQAELRSRGYEVIMIRTSNDVDISNAERAQIANLSQADAFLRIHADGYDDPTVHGATTICQTANNPFNGALYKQCKALAGAVLDGLTASAGCKKRAIQETDNMSGINWCEIPVTIVEVGFLTNPEEDALLSTEEYQNKIAVGIANGLDAYFAALS